MIQLHFPFKLISSLVKAKKIINKYRPDLVIGVGGFASGPILHIAAKRGITKPGRTISAH